MTTVHINTATYKYLCLTFVCIDSLEVHDVPYDVILVTYAITPKHVPCSSGNVQRLSTGVTFKKTDHLWGHPGVGE